MNALLKLIAINTRRFGRQVLRQPDKFEASYSNAEYFGQAASNVIANGLHGLAPFSVSRFGYSELRTLLTYTHIHEQSSSFEKLVAFGSGKKVEPWWTPATLKLITYNAGVFPNRIETVEQFCRLILDCIPNLDVIGSWLGGERLLKPMMPNAKFVRFSDLYHFHHGDPWTLALQGKKVLVVHPFARSIRLQFQKRESIYQGIHTLPEFELTTVKAVQSIAGNYPVAFRDWFEALEYMKEEIAKVEFDIAIIGCGAYGMPLASFVKSSLRKKAIHLGGLVQILFGIIGSRWENDPSFKHIFNEHWIRPQPEETPKGHETIDDNCYW